MSDNRPDPAPLSQSEMDTIASIEKDLTEAGVLEEGRAAIRLILGWKEARKHGGNKAVLEAMSRSFSRSAS